MVKLHTVHRLPLSAVEYDGLKEFALACNPHIEDMLISSRTSLMEHLKANYSLYSFQLRELLQTTVSLIHLSTDLWTSPNRHSLLAICVQWVDADYNFRKVLLGLPECRYSHSGSAQASLIVEVLKSYSIYSRLGYHVGDNATSNDTCLQALSATLHDRYGVRLFTLSERVLLIYIRSFLMPLSVESAASAISSISPYKPSSSPARSRLSPQLLLLLKPLLITKPSSGSLHI